MTHSADPVSLLYLSESPHFGGGEVSLLTLVQHLDRRRYHPIVICYGSGKLSDRLSALAIENYSLILKRKNLFSNVTVILNLIHLIKKHRVRLVHVNTLDIRGGIAARLSGVPLVGHLHVIFPLTWLDRLFVRLATRIISVSDAARDYFCDRHRGLIPKFVTIPNSISVERLSPITDVRAELGLSPDTRLVGAVSRIDPWKGLHTFIHMAAKIKRRIPGIKFLLLGSADRSDSEARAYEDQLHRLTAELGLTDDLFFLGFRHDALSIIQQIDVLTVTSRILETKSGIKTEGFGLVIIEAMALNTPVVATRVGGIPEIIIHRKSGLLVPPESPDQMADAVSSLLEDVELASKIVQGGKQRFLERYNIKSHMAQTQDLYEKVLQSDGQ